MLGRLIEIKSTEPVPKRKAGSTSPALLFLGDSLRRPQGKPTPMNANSGSHSEQKRPVWKL